MKIERFKIERYYGLYEFTTKYMLSSSDAETWSVEEILSMGGQFDTNLQTFLNFQLGYTESQGDPELRNQISRLYQNTSPDNVVVFSGAEEAIFTFMMSTLQTDDEIIVMFPAYQSLYEIAKANGVKVNNWKLKEEKNWKPEIDELHSMMTSKTRAIIINSPHNPTGFQFSAEELLQIVKFCESNDLVLFSDEVYRFGEYGNHSIHPPATDLYKNAITLGVLSKPFGLPGLRIGWLVVKNPEIMDEIKAFKDYTTICNSGPSEFLATLALKNREIILQRNREIMTYNFKLLENFINDYSEYFGLIKPQSGCIGFVRIKFNKDATEFCKEVREKMDVLLLPSTTYNFGNKHFRIGFGRKNFPEVLELLIHYVKEHLIHN